MRKILFLLIFFGIVPSAWAWDFIGARPLGMGGAHRAIVTGNDSIFLNPAGMSLFKRYAFEVQYLAKPDWNGGDSQAEHIFNASVVDNQLAPFATGLAYTRVERSDSKKGNRYDLAFSYDLTPNLMIGTTVKYLTYDRDGKENAIDAVSLDIGILLRFDFGLHIGVVGYDLTNTADYLEHPISMAAAIMYSPFRALELSFDWFINFQKPLDAAEPLGDKETAYSFHFGAEYLLFGQFLIRAGYVIDAANPYQDDEQFWTVGAGYVSPTIAIDFGYQGSVFHTWNNTFGVVVRLFM
jgi:hypothetical protein